MEAPIRRVMVYVDGSDESITAAQYAISLCVATGAELSAAYVINTRALAELKGAKIFLESEAEEYEQDMEDNATRYLDLVRSMAASKGVEAHTFQAAGSCHEEIRRLIVREQIDLLCVGEISHIRSRRDQTYDETERTLRGASCSVVVVRNPDRVAEVYDSIE